LLFCLLDKDECLLGEDNCHANAVCNDTIGSFNCTCKEGYSGDGVTQCKGDSQIIQLL